MTPTPTLEDRAMGALIGAFIGDALALGPHWYYDLDQLRADYGPWISDYTTPKTGRYHAGMQAGQLSQSGVLLRLTLQSLVDCGGYDEADFCRRLDDELFPQLDGTPMNGPGGYTSQSIREAWRLRVKSGLPWGQVGGNADTTEAAERILGIAIRYALQPAQLASAVSRNTALTQTDGTVVAMTVAFGAVLGMLVEGQKLDANISGKLMARIKSGELPFHTVTSGNLQAPPANQPEAPAAGRFPSPDALLSPSFIAQAATDPDIHIDPAWKVSLVYGLPCAIYHQLPAAYYLAARFHDDFESAVLHAINGGGQNQSRAILTGALTGAQTGLSEIPRRFIDGLENGEELLDLAGRLAKQMVV
ncbi:MAG: ADP-ribosylglycohydrolase family protein [Gammaproteobacteria bacterium]|nr:ADP-ribosylglycohydrolase family protein [Gammaproteobacteria bacterium]MBU1600451.1 ADP-ribosylglycohydrolase family protein [Gammaproteobacteria bacterium]MBU2434907.1 ADP-ribosylglycohydrolase family protein [Gammaproteobacteria bacterium]MBU2448143.1 ADP-ribosylglycohydrolase family protein [Gammaproteobacteria bacterium]